MDTQIFEARESNVRSYSLSFPTVFDRALGSELFDAEGKRYLDFFVGAGTLNYGHNPPHLKRLLIEYLERDGILHALDASTIAKARLLEALTDDLLAPRGYDYKVQFCGPTGTNAVEAALKLARRVTGRQTVIAFSGSYHGMSMGSAAVTGSQGTRRSAGVPLHHTYFVPYENGPEGPFDSLGLLERMLADPSSGLDAPAAVIVEGVQMDGGVYPASVPFLQGLRRLCDRHGLLLIVDDIQAGCGRTGRFFSFEAAGIQPDLVTLSKSISGIGLPMSLVLIRRDRDVWKPGEHTGTFRGNQLAFVAAAEALAIWKSADFTRELGVKSDLLHSWLGQHVLPLAPGLELRGVGLVAGLDFRRVGPDVANRVQEECFARGLVIETCGRADVVLKAIPPLTISEAHLLEGCAIIRDAVRAVVGTATASGAAAS